MCFKKFSLAIRKTISLLMLTLFVCQLFIYPLVLSKRLDAESNIHTSSIAEQEEAPETLEIKLGMALPYSSDWVEPKESEGLLEHNGAFYTLVSRDYQNDSLHFTYVKNSNAREIFSLLSDHVDPDQNSSDKEKPNNTSVLKWVSAKYLKNNDPELNPDFGLFALKGAEFSYRNFYSFDFTNLVSQPPRLS